MAVTLGYPEAVDVFAGYKVGADWAWHLAHGSTGGTDYIVAPNVKLTSPISGVVYYKNDAYNTMGITHASGIKIEFEEVKQRVAKEGSTIRTGQILLVTGLLRAGGARWPHVHGFAKGSTKRIPYETALEAIIGYEKATLAKLVKAASATKLTDKQTVQYAAKYLNSLPQYKKTPSTASERDGARTLIYLRRIQSTWKARGHAITVTGVFGPRTKAAEAYLAQLGRKL